MKLTVNNKQLCVGDLIAEGVGSSSLVLVGDANVITSYSYFDTPASSLIFSPEVPLNPREQPGDGTVRLADPEK